MKPLEIPGMLHAHHAKAAAAHELAIGEADELVLEAAVAGDAEDVGSGVGLGRFGPRGEAHEIDEERGFQRFGRDRSGRGGYLGGRGHGRERGPDKQAPREERAEQTCAVGGATHQKSRVARSKAVLGAESIWPKFLGSDQRSPAML